MGEGGTNHFGGNYMHARFFAAIAVVALGSVSARAADLNYPMAVEPMVAPLTYNWTGLYVGAHAGYGWGTGDPQTVGTPTQHPDGGFGGAQIGYNFQLPSNVVVGVEADVSFADLDDSRLDGTALRLTSEMDYFGTVRLRIGYAFDRFLPYVTGGMAWAHAKGGMSCPDGAPVFTVCSTTGPFSLSDSSTSVGWTIGAGVEYAFADNWTAKLEYFYADLGDATLILDVPVLGETSEKVDQTLNVVRLGVSYRFDGLFASSY